MQTSPRLARVTRLPLLCGLIVLVFVLAACQPIPDPGLQGQAAAGTAEPAEEAIPGVGPAMATITADSLRVRSAPSDNAEVVTGARVGEIYPVLAISSDGGWLQLEIERAPEGNGWVASSFVTLEGDITNIPTIEVADVLAEAGIEPSEPAATPEPAEEATEEPTEEAEEAAEATPEPTAEPTEEPAEEATAEPTAEASEEMTATAEITETATVTVEAEITATEEMTATVTASEEITETEEVTATEEVTETAEEVEAPAIGFVTVNTGGTPLRVRSAPTTEEDNKVGNVFDGETYRVLEVSEDGLWVRIEVPELELENGGWVSAEYVVMGE